MKTKNRIWIYPLIVMGLIVMFTNSCEKDTVETTVKDIDGNIYNTIKIGDQTWMVENLKTTKYNDGTEIPNITDKDEWKTLSTPAYCWYDNDFANENSYGALYNGYAINTAKLAPTGWHVATNDEWLQLIDSVGGLIIAAAKLKEMGTIHWQEPNEHETNEVGFTALPGGTRDSGGTFYYIGLEGAWWSATETNDNRNFNCRMYHKWDDVWNTYSYKVNGLSVRCVKD
jgi:uncharacterized protein (TIGR02145 family)